MNKTLKIITAFTIGSAAGAFLGLLMASGEKNEAIRKMKEEKNLFPEDFRNKYSNGKENLRNQLETKGQKVNV